AASLGNDGRTLGDRNAPTLTYASLVPPSGEDEDGAYIGGLFHDGRAATLEDQAKQPIVSPMEMALLSPAAVRERVLANPAYVNAFERLLGPASLATPDSALDAVATALAAFERSAEFSSFDSKYDRYLRGEATLTREEELGRILFFSDLVNCSQCHLLDGRADQAGETFSNYRYHNIGIPPNARVRATNADRRPDPGLAGHPDVGTAGERGRFRVPSLRNVAVTGPYMHNGVFRDLRTAIVFYNRFLVENAASEINPETGRTWDDPEVPETVDLDLLKQGQPLTEQRVAQLEAFLRTLTDRRYEPLLGP
ncbi:MAG: cytochrome c peroxidase, partial [Woeseiaceae bacterium]|nr:cytochrome c peroxidase [Woeseiaceae bacterium]